MNHLPTVPLSVPSSKKTLFLKNFNLATRRTGRLLLFAGDQRVEHLNDDFYGEGIPTEDASPEHLFKIAANSRIGLFATQLGYINRYGAKYPKIPYLVKLNSKSHLVPVGQQEPYSGAWYDVRQVVEFAKQSKLNIPAIGYTVYVGSSFEAAMLKEAAQLVWQAHQYGLLAVLWMYPRGKAVDNQNDPHLIAGAVNVGTALGADFVKVDRPEPASSEGYGEIFAAGEGTRVLFAGGKSQHASSLFGTIAEQMAAGASGVALGRNIHQRKLKEAIALTNAVAGIVYDRQVPPLGN